MAVFREKDFGMIFASVAMAAYVAMFIVDFLLPKAGPPYRCQEDVLYEDDDPGRRTGAS